ncbi:hypothetical protein MLD38_028110 [Melastoma candidum]|uniref:Uncharacterized protein n=1 Tax=Melastoma candidum TaxID=119954 RepID=A0ACB9N1S7_9MYRT|nr:hypothetical protein MLD38_028110 [Melastoma candidum]
MARRGIRFLLLALSLPLSLTLFAIYLFGHRRSVPNGHPCPSPPWSLPQWILQGMSIVSSGLIGLSVWLVWAEGVSTGTPKLALSTSHNWVLACRGIQSCSRSGRIGSGLQ